MKNRKSMKIGTKITLKLLAVLAVLLLAAFSYIVYTSYTRNMQTEKDSINSLSQKNAIAAKAILDRPLQTATALAHALEGFQSIDAKDRRAYYNSIMQAMIQNDSSILGLWTVWEPNAFDGMDSSYAGKDGTDATGRFIPYWVWDSGAVSNVACVDYDKAGAGDYYLLAKDSGKDTVLEPYTYQISGKDVLMTTFSVPIKDASGKVLGVAGVDMTLANLQSTHFDNGPYTDSYTFLVTNGGNLVIHPDSKVVGGSLSKILAAGNTANVAQAIKDGKASQSMTRPSRTGSPPKSRSCPCPSGTASPPGPRPCSHTPMTSTPPRTRPR